MWSCLKRYFLVPQEFWILNHFIITYLQMCHIMFSSVSLACKILATPLSREGGRQFQDGNLVWVMETWGNPHTNTFGDQRWKNDCHCHIRAVSLGFVLSSNDHWKKIYLICLRSLKSWLWNLCHQFPNQYGLNLFHPNLNPFPTYVCPSHASVAPRLDQCLPCEASAGQWS